METDNNPLELRSLILILGTFLLFISCGGGGNTSPGVPLEKQWLKTYGGTGNDSAYALRQTSDGGYVVAGSTTSFGAGSADAWVLKLDGSGNILWQKTYGGTGDDSARAIQQTSDGGYVVAGSTTSFGAGGPDAWVLKLDDSGNVLWQKTYGGSFFESANAIQRTPDGGYVIIGSTTSFGVSFSDAWILKLDGIGNVLWQKRYGFGGENTINALQQTSDGGYITANIASNLSAPQAPDTAWVTRLDSGGSVVWAQLYYGVNSSRFTSMQQTPDGGFIMAGDNGNSRFSYHAWVLKLDGSGNILWQKTYGGTSLDHAATIQLTSDSGYIIAGSTASFGAGGADAWVLKLDNSGNVLWQKTYGGTGDDSAQAIQQTADGGYIVAGSTTCFGTGGVDAWVLKLDGSGNITGCSSVGTSDGVPNNVNGGTSSTTVVTSENTTAVTSNSTASVNDTTATAVEVCFGSI
jgi:predicted secreted protein